MPIDQNELERIKRSLEAQRRDRRDQQIAEIGVENEAAVIKSASAAGSIGGSALRALEYAGRPYSAVNAGIYGLATGQDPFPLMGRAIKGEEYFSGEDILTTAGVPKGQWSKWGGLAWDFGPGAVYDPLTYLTLGFTKVGKAAKIAEKGVMKAKTVKGLVGAAEGLNKARSAAGLAVGATEGLSRVEAAARGLWGPINFAGRTITPRGVNVGAARAFEATLGKIPDLKVVQAARKYVGGRRGLDEKYFPGLRETKAELNVQRIDRLKAAAEPLSAMQKNFTETARRTMSDLWENPKLGQGVPVKVRIPQKPTLADLTAFVAENKPLIRARINTTQAHRGRFLIELDALGNTVVRMHDEAGHYGTVGMDDLSRMFGDMNTYELTQHFLDADNGFDLEDVVTTYLRDAGEIADTDRGSLIGIFSQGEWDVLTQKHGAPRSVTVLEASQIPEGAKGWKFNKETGVFQKKKTSGGRIWEEAKRAWARKRKAGASGEEFRLGAEFSHQIGEVPVIVYRTPGFSTLAEPLRQLGGITRTLDARKKTAQNIIGAFRKFANDGGDTLEMASRFADSTNQALPIAERAKARGLWKEQVKKIGLDPNSRSVESIMAAVHEQIWSSSFAPGDYTRNLEELARAHLDELFLDPVERYEATQARLRRLINQTAVDLDELDNGHWKPPTDVPGEFPDVSDAERMATAASDRVKATNRLQNTRGLIKEKQLVVDNAFDWETGRELLSPEDYARTTRELDVLRDDEFRLSSFIGDDGNELGGPIREVQNARREELVRQMDDLRAELYNPDPFDKSMFVRRELEKNAPHVWQAPVKEETITTLAGATPELTRAVAEGEAILAPTEERFLRQIRGYDPSANMPISNYLPHTLDESRGIKAWWNGRKSKRAVEEFRNQRRTYYIAEKKWVDAKRIDQQVTEDTRAFFGIDRVTGRDVARGTSPHFKQRKYRFSLLEMRKSDLGVNFADDFPFLLNRKIKTLEDWMYGDDLYRFAKEKFGALGKEADPSWVPINYHVPFIDPAKNPYKGWFIPKEADKVLQGVFKNSREFTTDESFKGMLDVLHYVRRHFSAWTLCPFPAYDVRNLISDMQRAAMEDLKWYTPQGAHSYRAAVQILGHTTKIPDSAIFKPFRSKFANPKALDEVVDLLKKTWPNEDVTRESVLRLMRRDEIAEGWLRDLDVSFEKALVSAGDKRTLLEKAISKSPLSILMPLEKSDFIRVMGNKSQKINDFTRVALWIDKMKRNTKIPGLMFGDAVTDATATVRRALYDYKDLTAFEQNVLKLAFPFYTFTAKNIPYQLSKVFTEPNRFAWMARAYNGSWDSYEGELEPQDVPEWMIESLGMPMSRMVDKKTGQTSYAIFSPRGWMPVSEINELAQAFRTGSGPFKYLLTQANPVIKELLEQSLNMDTYTGRQIEKGQSRDIFGIGMPQWSAHILRNIRLITEIDNLNPTFFGAFPDGIWTSVGRARGTWTAERPHRQEAPVAWRWEKFLIGGRSYGIKPQEQVSKDLYGDVKEIKTLAWSEAAARRIGATSEVDKLMDRRVALTGTIKQKRDRLNEIRRQSAMNLQHQQREKGVLNDEIR